MNQLKKYIYYLLQNKSLTNVRSYLLKKLWFTFILLILFLAVMKSFNINFEDTATIAILLHSSIMIIILMTNKSKKVGTVFILAFLVRLFLVFWDIYAQHIFVLPNAATDDVGFYISAEAISRNLSLLNTNIYGGLYAKTIGLVFYFTGSSKILGGYINVMLGMSVIYIVLHTLRMLKIPHKVKLLIILIIAFFPNSLFMSAMFRREMIITFFVASSVYFFIKWFLSGKNAHMIFAIILIIVGAMFHSGVIGMIGGYIFAYVFYKPKKAEFKFNIYSVVYFIGICLIIYIMYLLVGEQFLAKFGNLDNVDDLVVASNRGGGNARYLSNLIITNPVELVLFTPIKMFYFLFSPVPWEWRGIGDLLAFGFDSFFYLYCGLFFIINRKKIGDNSKLSYILLFSILLTVLIFGIGVGNAGTAMRHRQKLVPIIAIFFATMLDGKEKNHINLLKERN